MMKLNLRFAERGTLLVEALAMLGLIAMVTPTLYKKSAERLQEIQDINAASQARTMHNVIETFMEANFTTLMSEASTKTGATIELSYNDSSGANYFSKGYSSYVPFGYNLGDIKNFAEPRVFVHTDGSSLVSFIVFETTGTIGKKRASRLAALVGANGGIVSPTFTGSAAGNEFMGTGNAWHLDNAMLNDIHLKDIIDGIAEDSLVVTSSEPLTQSNMESDKFLYRGPAENEGEFFRNQMVTDLFMGGHPDSTEWAGRGGVGNYYSIYNVRKLTLNSICTHDVLNNPESMSNPDFNCNPDVADLYIGKPVGGFEGHTSFNDGITAGNTGAAWIYGNLKVLDENFQLFHLGDGASEADGINHYDRSTGYDVLKFARMSASHSTELEVLRAENQTGSSSVKMMDGFVQVLEQGDSSVGSPVFLVGNSSTTGGGVDGAFITAQSITGNVNELRLNSPDNHTFAEGSEPITRINQGGGVVYINGGSSSVKRETYINETGGILEAGNKGSWLRVSNDGTSSEVILLGGQDLDPPGSDSSTSDARLFLVGTNNVNKNYMIFADAQKTALRGGQLRVYSPRYTSNYDSTRVGGEQIVWDLEGSESGATVPDQGATAILSRYTDILGSTYLGRSSMISSEADGLVYSRGNYRLGVAGSAWVDQFLFARQAWFNDAGLRELHAGFNNYAEYYASSKAGWLNVYDDGVIIRDKDQALAHSGDRWDSSDVMFKADSTGVYIRDHEGAWVELTQGQAYIGNKENYFYASSTDTDSTEPSAANMVGSTLANIYTTGSTVANKVNIQKDAMTFYGHGSTMTNTIDARAQEFTIHTSDATATDNSGAQFYVDGTDIRTRYVDFSVEDDDSSAVFKVRPNGENLGPDDAQVQVHGTFLVDNNDVIHIGTNEDTIAGTDEKNKHAMLEIETSYVQVMAKNADNSIFTNEDGSSYAMFKVNSKDIGGRATEDNDASVYIRRGAIELEASTPDREGNKYAADEGYGYILANRLVSPGPDESSTIPHSAEGAYDTYMVNPTYTSVMHDIKLTTRGGARLSDALPDYVLKGVYNLINNCKEGNRPDTTCNITDMSENADPYIGIIPLPICPHGYERLATVVPISFQMGQAGPISYDGGRFKVDQSEKQARILQRAQSLGGRIAYPALEETSSYTYNSIYATDTSFSTFANSMITRAEGWFWGFRADYPDTSSLVHSNEHSSETFGGGHLPIETYRPTGEEWKVVAEPLYFQQNTWLKTSIEPVSGTGWRAYMGFLYDTSSWGTTLGGVTAPVNKNNNEAGGGNESEQNTLAGTYLWNVFPVPTNSLEGHATVYCYFNRSNFNDDWNGLIDRTDNLSTVRSGSPADVNKSSASEYVKRLNDPHLKYSDPW